MKNEDTQSENVDLSFNLQQQKLINPPKMTYWKTTVIHGWDIK